MDANPFACRCSRSPQSSSQDRKSQDRKSTVYAPIVDRKTLRHKGANLGARDANAGLSGSAVARVDKPPVLTDTVTVSDHLPAARSLPTTHGRPRSALESKWQPTCNRSPHASDATPCKSGGLACARSAPSGSCGNRAASRAIPFTSAMPRCRCFPYAVSRWSGPARPAPAWPRPWKPCSDRGSWRKSSSSVGSTSPATVCASRTHSFARRPPGRR